MTRNTVRVAVYGIVLFILGGAAVYGLDIMIIPITYYEKQGTGYVQKTYRRDITADISAMLNKYYNIQVSKAAHNDRLAGVTDFDARRVAEYYHVEDVLYGAIKEDGSSLQAELKIYNRRRDDYGLFYASDTNSQYERLIRTVSEHIMGWYNTDRDKVDLLKHALQDLQTEIALIKEELDNRASAGGAEQDGAIAQARQAAQDAVEKELILRLPVNAGYWSYIDHLWVETVQGTVGAVIGLDMCPELQFSELYGMKNEMSLGLNMGYRNGITNNKDGVLMHGIFINPEIRYHLNFYTKNWICIGGGVFYELDIWKIEDREYQQSASFKQSLTGYSVSLDYAYRINRLFTVDMGANLYGYFVAGSSLVVRSYLGIVITLTGGKHGK